MLHFFTFQYDQNQTGQQTNIKKTSVYSVDLHALMSWNNTNNVRFTDQNMEPAEAVAALFKKFYGPLCQSTFRLLKDQQLSEDLVQEVFIRIWDKKDQLTFDERFIGYLRKSCYHAALAYLAQQRQPYLVEEQELTSTDSKILTRELEEAIVEGINSMPEKTKLIFTLSRYESMTYKEIAIQMELSVKAIEKHMGIALKFMRDHLSEFLMWAVFILT